MPVFSVNLFGLFYLPDNCWDIAKNKEVQVFQNWGDVYKIEFCIKVAKWPAVEWTNVFHISETGNNCCNIGDRIPALFVNKNGFFYVCSAVDGNGDYCKKFHFEIGKQNQMTIQQLKENGEYWYEIIIDGASKFKIENKQPKKFSNVKLYASDPWYNPFSSDLGNICNVNIIQPEEGKG